MPSPPEKSRLKELEQVIKKGLDVFQEVAIALKEIQTKKLYLEAGYDDFGKYCQGEYGRGYNWAYKMISAGEIQATVSKPLPSASAANALRPVPPKKREEVILKAEKATGGKVTAEAIKNAAKPPPKCRIEVSVAASKGVQTQMLGREVAKTVALDGTGIEVPPECLELWRRGTEAQTLLSKISEVRVMLSRYFESKDKLFVEVDFNDVTGWCNQLYTTLKLAVPYAICPTCNGVMKDCTACKGRGFVSKFYWDTFVPTEIKKLRE